MFIELLTQISELKPVAPVKTERRFVMEPAWEASKIKPVKTFNPIMSGKGWMTANYIAAVANRNTTSVTTSMKFLMSMGFVSRRRSAKNPREFEYIWEP